jgi:molybdopterin molybdotransferase
MPPGADTVVPIEEVVLSSDKAHLKFSSSPKPGQFVRCAGEDIHTGQKIARGGDLLTAGRLALISSAGCGVVDVYRRAKVVIVTNGDELTDHSTAPGDLSGGQIYESNGMMLAALARTAGADVSAVLSVADSVDALRETIREIGRTLKPDIILSSGGVSVGDRDYVRHVLAEMGSIVFWRASIRPGKPVVFGNVGGSHFLGLPGNPASSLVTFEIFARPLIAKLQGKLEPLKFFWTVLGEHVSHEPGRQSFVRMCTTLTDRGLVSSSAGEQGSHILSSLAEANSIVVIPEDVSELDAGARAQCLITSPFPFDN